jgi:hypothetical protein
MPGVALPTDPVFPDWVNLSDTWREQDAEWLRNRSVLVFDAPPPSSASPSTASCRSSRRLPAPRPRPVFYNASMRGRACATN